MSDTPRTDAISSPETDNRLYLARMIDHARTLERELAAAQDLAWRRVLQLDELEKQISLTVQPGPMNSLNPSSATPRTHNFMRLLEPTAMPEDEVIKMFHIFCCQLEGEVNAAKFDNARLRAAECDIIPNALKPIETAPKDADGILAYSPSFYQNKGGWVAAVWHRDGWHSNPGGWRFEPTHWMPFPDAPPTVTSPHHKGE